MSRQHGSALLQFGYSVVCCVLPVVLFFAGLGALDRLLGSPVYAYASRWADTVYDEHGRVMVMDARERAQAEALAAVVRRQGRRSYHTALDEPVPYDRNGRIDLAERVIERARVARQKRQTSEPLMRLAESTDVASDAPRQPLRSLEKEEVATAPPPATTPRSEEPRLFGLVDGDNQPAPAQPMPAAAAPPAPPAAPASLLTIEPAGLQRLGFQGVERVATGDPKIADVSVVSEDELLVYGRDSGTTNLVVWDRGGVHAYNVVVTPGTGPAVKLTVQLVEMLREASGELGIDWSDAMTFTETTFGPLGPAGSSEIARVGEAFRIGALSRTGADSVLNLLIQRGKARVLAEPKLVSSSGQEAATFVGVEVPVITASTVSSGAVTQNIEFKKTGVELKFTPTVLADGRSIRLPVDAKVSSVDRTQAIVVSGITVPGFRVRQTQTDIVTENGQAVVISGLLQDEERKNLSQLPGLGDIPVLGNLFRSTEFSNGQTELVIVVTPTLRTPVELADDRTVALQHSIASAAIPAEIRRER